MAEQKLTFCRICENQCGLKLTVEGDPVSYTHLTLPTSDLV